MATLKRAADPESGRPTILQKVFVRSRKGHATKIVREQYLRNDIPCSSQLCEPCRLNAPKDSSGMVRPPVLSATPPKTKALGPHYLVPDADVCVRAMDLLEHRSAFFDVIILQTVLESVRGQSLPLYNRLRALTRSETKRFYVFHNEFRMETSVRRESGESAKDWAKRAMRAACVWYQVHLEEATGSGAAPRVVLLSEDGEALEQARELAVDGTTLEAYVDGLANANELLDMISALDETSRPVGGVRHYPDYYPSARLLGGVQAGILHQGILNVSQYNFLEAAVAVPAFEQPLLVLGREAINRAVSGDVVVIELLAKDQWKRPSTRIVDEEAVARDDNPDDDAEAILTLAEQRALVEEAKRAQRKPVKGKAAREVSDLGPQPTARVVGIVKRNWRQYVCHIDPRSVPDVAAGSSRSQISVFCVPMNKTIPRIRIRTRQAATLVGQRIVVAIDAWEPTSRNPAGHFVRALGEVETKAVETESLLLEYDVQFQPFPQSVLDCLPVEGHDWRVPADTADPGWAKRRDLRDLDVCSIDPPGCQDIDDALHARLLPNGNYEVGVHIADVSHFVKPDTPMDTEGASRGTTVYLVDKRIDMLPHLLGTDLCSLKPYVERYAFSALWEMTPGADIVSTTFTKSVIKSKHAFSYEEAQLRIDDASNTDALTEGMRTLLRFSKLLKKRRIDAGALNLASPEVKIRVESETSDPVDAEVKQLHETNSLVEEFMLLANISVAARIYEAFPQSAMLRRHAPPPPSNFEVLADQLRVCKGMHLKVDSSHALADSLDACVDPNDPYINTLVRIKATRCMLAAEYFCSGTMSESEFRHYGLATPIYTHFTSPIRRYADIVAHRQLATAIEYEYLHPSLRDKPKLELICNNINRRHRNAQFAGRASVEYYVGQVLKSKQITTDGYVISVFSNGIVAFVPQFGVEGLIHNNDMATPPPPSAYDEQTYTIVYHPDTKNEVRLQLFDKVKIRVDTVVDEGTKKRKVQLRIAHPSI
ncbi:uncharacterized protein V1510DRAFT_412846 [Dipodascopsis tothii]|uniref:uncharacterized protein n=1 Tax=Dipodascopsis tothii TaxID=44089 RepID=UPI0034CDD62E